MKLVKHPKHGYAGTLHKLDFFLLQCMSEKSFLDLFANDIDSNIKANPELLDETLEDVIIQTIAKKREFCPVTDYDDEKIKKYIK